MTSSWLGFQDISVEEVEEPISSIDSFIGGTPLIPDDIALSENDVVCGRNGCDQRLVNIAQIYCPLDSHHTMHRSLVILACPKEVCCKTLQGWRVFRMQWKNSDPYGSKNNQSGGHSQSSQGEPQIELFERCDTWGDEEEGSEETNKDKPEKGQASDELVCTKKQRMESEKVKDGTTAAAKVQFEKKLDQFLVEFEAENYDGGSDNEADAADEEDADDDDEDTKTFKEKTFEQFKNKEGISVFNKFYHRISKEPQQIIRYGGLGEYIAVYDDKLKYPLKCGTCSTQLGCELQLLPTVSSCFTDCFLPVCSLGVFTCPNTSTCADFSNSCLRVDSLLLEIES